MASVSPTDYFTCACLAGTNHLDLDRKEFDSATVADVNTLWHVVTEGNQTVSETMHFLDDAKAGEGGAAFDV